MDRFIKTGGEIPGLKSLKLKEEMERHTPRGINHATTIAIAEAKGARVTDVDGNTYLDFTGGIGVLNVGHRADEVVEAIKKQADRYLHLCFSVFIYESYIALARRLNEVTPGNFAKKTIFLNSGAEAVENAIKFARSYTKRYGILSFERSFHGRTFTALSLTGQIDPYKYGFGPFMSEVHHLPYAYCYRCPFEKEYPTCELRCAMYIEELFNSRIAPDTVAALIVEPVLGEGGFVVPPKEFLPLLKSICAKHGIVFVADEIQSGMGRTGKMFAIEHFGVVPDLITTAKSLGGGMVLSAVTGRAEIMDAPQIGGVGGTYGGNPLSCVAGLAVFDIVEKENLLARGQGIGEKIRSSFLEMQQRYPVVGDVRGLGSMMAMEFVKDRKTKEPAPELVASIIASCQREGLILLSTGGYHNVIRVLAPLIISDEELDAALTILESAIAETM